MKKGLAVTLVLALLSLGTAAAEAPAGTSQQIVFAENPTTGYVWSVVSENESIVTVADDGFAAFAETAGLEGAGGSHAWTLTAKSLGETNVTFTLGQGWEGGEAADKIVYHCTVDANLTLDLYPLEGYPELYTPGKAAVILYENPTTGFEWKYALSNETVLTYAWDEYYMFGAKADEPDIRVGEGGAHEWVFTAAAPGDVTVTFTYARSWEAGVAPEATVTYTFHVDDSLNATQTGVDGDYETYDAMIADVE